MGLGITEVVSGAVGGAVIQSIIAPALLNSRARRDLRAQVLRRIGDVERRRWVPRTWDELNESLAGLTADALVANMPRDLVDIYAAASRASLLASEASAEEDIEGNGYIPSRLADFCRACSEAIVRAAWHPHRSRWVPGSRLTQLVLEIEHLPAVLDQLAARRPDLAVAGDPLEGTKPEWLARRR